MGKRSVGRATVVLAILATLALVGCQTTAPSAAPSGALGNGQVASLEIVPAAVLLTNQGETRPLTVVARDASGTVVAAPSVAWDTSDAASASVDAAGVVTAVASVGSARVSATAGDIRAEPAVVTVATTVGGTILVGDAQVVSGPTVTKRGTAPEDYELEVVLRDAGAMAPGAHIVSVESNPVAGVVLSSTADGGNQRIRYRLAPPKELFSDFVFRDSVDLGVGPYGVPEPIAAAYDVRQSDNTVTLTPKAGATGSGQSRQLSASVGLTLASWTQPGAAARALLAEDGEVPPVPPFTSCELEAGTGGDNPLPLTPSFAPTVTLTMDGELEREISPAGTRITATVTPEIKAEVALELKAAIEASYTCKLEVSHKTFRLPGWLAILGGVVAFGIGFELKGEATLVGAKVGGEVEYQPTIGGTVVCGTDCAFDGRSENPSPKFEPTFELPTSFESAAFEPSLTLFGYAAAKLGQPDLDILFEAIDGKAGVELSGSYTLEALQIDNTDDEEGKSKYELALKGEVEPGEEVEDFVEWLGYEPGLLPTFEVELPLGASPKATVEADADRYLPGETATITVRVDPDSLAFPLVVNNDNIARIAIVRKTGAGFETETLAELEGPPGQTEFVFEFQAPHLIDADELFAFVVPEFLPLELPRLELDEAAVPIKFTFDEDLEGWRGFGIGARSNTKPWGTYEWRPTRGGGAARISGVGGEGRINAQLYREIELPANAKKLVFKASGDEGHDFADSLLRVRIRADGQSTRLFNDVIVNTRSALTYREIELDISAFAGQTVTIVFEQDDDGDHLHEHVYLDDIEIRTGA